MHHVFLHTNDRTLCRCGESNRADAFTYGKSDKWLRCDAELMRMPTGELLTGISVRRGKRTLWITLNWIACRFPQCMRCKKTFGSGRSHGSDITGGKGWGEDVWSSKRSTTVHRKSKNQGTFSHIITRAYCSNVRFLVALKCEIIHLKSRKQKSERCRRFRITWLPRGTSISNLARFFNWRTWRTSRFWKFLR